MVEIIGFIISLLALLYIFIKQNTAVQRQAHPSHDKNEDVSQGNPFAEFLKTVEKEAVAKEEAHRLPPPPPKVFPKKPKKPSRHSLEEYRLTSSIEDRRIKSHLEDRHMTSRFNQHEELPGRTLARTMNHHLLEEEKKAGPSRAGRSIQRLAQRRDLLIYQEIMDKPKSMRSFL